MPAAPPRAVRVRDFNRIPAKEQAAAGAGDRPTPPRKQSRGGSAVAIHYCRGVSMAAAARRGQAGRTADHQHGDAYAANNRETGEGCLENRFGDMQTTDGHKPASAPLLSHCSFRRRLIARTVIDAAAAKSTRPLQSQRGEWRNRETAFVVAGQYCQIAGIVNIK